MRAAAKPSPRARGGKGIRAARLALLLPVVLSVAGAGTPFEPLSLEQLGQRLREIDAQLSGLASYSLSSGIGAIGYRSRPHDVAERTEWIEIRLREHVPIDEIVLVPTLRRTSTKGFEADGFPAAFRVFAGTEGDRTGRLVAEYSPASRHLPRIAPLSISGGGLPASWVRVEARILSRRAFDGRHVLNLAEILVFSGHENVALHQPVITSSGNDPSYAPGWHEAFLADGFLPYLMVAAGGKGSIAYVNQAPLGDNPALTIDLGSSQRLTGVHLHAVDQSDTVPQAFAGDLGLPKQLRIEGASVADFSDGRVLVEIGHDTIYDVGPILMRYFPAADCRYVRIHAIGPHFNPLYGPIPERMGLAEIELFAEGRNVALHRPVSANFNPEAGPRRLSHLTDGLNFYGPILPVRDWLTQLAQRHELERERPEVEAELARRHAAQSQHVVRLAWLAGILGVGVVGIAVASWIRQQRVVAQTRKRIAADLHDELGADLHAIGLLSDLARTTEPGDGRREEILRRMRSLTERAGKAARHCTNLLEAPGLYGDPVDEMHRAAARLLADLDHTLEIEDASLVRALKVRRQTDLLLFYQECLINIIRHSGATRVETRLWFEAGLVHLTVADNGHGLDGGVPASLRRRSRLLGADVTAERPAGGGLRIRLRMKTRRFALLP